MGTHFQCTQRRKPSFAQHCPPVAPFLHKPLTTRLYPPHARPRQTLGDEACDSLTGGPVRILMVEDHETLGLAVQEALQRARYLADWCHNLDEAEAAMAGRSYDLILLDLSLPDGDGLEFLRQVRSARVHTPIIVLTARGGLNDRIAGLDDGADDYLVKPFQLSEMVSRVRAVLRRPERLAMEAIRLGRVVFHPVSGDITIGDRPVVLSRREQQLLIALLRRSGRVCSRDHLEDSLYDQNADVGPNALESSVSRLRAYLTLHEAGVDVRTVRGVGYVLAEASMGAEADHD